MQNALRNIHPRLKTLGIPYLSWSLNNQNKQCRLEEPNYPKNSSKPQSRNSNLYAKRWKLSIYLSSDNLRVKTLTYLAQLFRKHALEFFGCGERDKNRELSMEWEKSVDGKSVSYFFLGKLTYGLGTLENVFIDNYTLISTMWL